MEAEYTERRFESAYWALRVTFGLVPFLAGLDKFFDVLANWDRYLAPSFARMIPMAPHTFMMIVGVVEMIVGLAVLTRFTRVGAYVAMVWLACIAVNLLAARYIDIAVRDLAMAVGAFALARLDEVRATTPVAQRRRAMTTAHATG